MLLSIGLMLDPIRAVRVDRGNSLIRERTPLGLYCRTMPRFLGGSYGGGCFLMSEATLYTARSEKSL